MVIDAKEFCSIIESEFAYLISDYHFILLNKYDNNISEAELYTRYEVGFKNQYIELNIGYYFEKCRDSFWYITIIPYSFINYHKSKNDILDIINETMSFPFFAIVSLLDSNHMNEFYNLKDFKLKIKCIAELLQKHGISILQGNYNLLSKLNKHTENFEFDELRSEDDFYTSYKYIENGEEFETSNLDIYIDKRKLQLKEQKEIIFNNIINNHMIFSR